MIDLFSFNKSLKTIWIKKYLDKTNLGKWKLFFDLELSRYCGEAVFLGNLDKTDTKRSFQTSDTFINEILQIWAEVNHTDNILSLQHYNEQPLWNNSLIRIDRKPAFIRQWLKEGILSIEHLKKNPTTFLSYKEFLTKYSLKPCFLAFNGIISTLKSLRERFKNNIINIEKEDVKPFNKSFLVTKKPSNLVYRNLVALKSEKPLSSQAKWQNDCKLEDEIDWKKTFQRARTCTKSTKIIIFQFKLLHRRLATNSFLFKISARDNDRCTFCGGETETLLHIFWNCTLTSLFWKSIFNWLRAGSLIQNENLDMITALGLSPDTSDAKLEINFCCLMSRYHIWLCKMKNEIPNFPQFLRFLKKTYEIEKNGSNDPPEKWKPLLDHL